MSFSIGMFCLSKKSVPRGELVIHYSQIRETNDNVHSIQTFYQLTFLTYGYLLTCGSADQFFSTKIVANKE